MWISILFLHLYYTHMVNSTKTTGKLMVIEGEKVNEELITDVAYTPTITASYLECSKRQDCDTIILEDHPNGFQTSGYLLSKIQKNKNGESVKDIGVNKNVMLLREIEDGQSEPEDDIQECKNTSCNENAKCVDYNGVQQCVCICGYTRKGKFCQSEDFGEMFKRDKLELFPKECVPLKNNKIGVLKKIGKTYRVKFDVYGTNLVGTWTNVIFIGRSGKFDRNPAVYFRPSSAHDTGYKFSVRTFVNGKEDRGYDSQIYPLKQWIEVEIFQEKIKNAYTFFLKLDGEIVYHVDNTTPREVLNANLYISDPWESACKGLIRKLTIEV